MVVRAAQPAPHSVLIGAWGPSAGPARSRSSGCASRSASTTTSRRSTPRFRADRADRRARAPRAVASPDAPPGAVRGARLGDLRAADRVLARGRDRAADRSPARPLERAAGTQRRCATCRAPRCSPARRRRCSSPSTSPPAGRSRCAARRARWPAAASICTAPTTSARGGGCGRCPASAAGPSSASRLHGQGRFDAAAGRRSRRCASWSGGCAAATRGERAQEEEVREFFAPYAPWGGLAATYAMRLRLGPAAGGAYAPCPGRNSSVIARPALRRVRRAGRCGASRRRRSARRRGPGSQTACRGRSVR